MKLETHRYHFLYQLHSAGILVSPKLLLQLLYLLQQFELILS